MLDMTQFHERLVEYYAMVVLTAVAPYSLLVAEEWHTDDG
jgi:hypothetical protein